MKITLSPAGFVLVLFLLSSPSFSLRCYNCNSRHDKSCYNLTMGKSHNTVVQDCEQEGMECLQKVGKIYKISYFYNFLTFLRLFIGDNNKPFLLQFYISFSDRNHGELVVFRECSHLHFPSKCNDNQVRQWPELASYQCILQDSCQWYCRTDFCNTGLRGQMPTSDHQSPPQSNPVKSRSGTSMFIGFQGYLTLPFSVLGPLLYNYP